MTTDDKPCVYCGRSPRKIETDDKTCRGCGAPRWMKRPFTIKTGRTVITQQVWDGNTNLFVPVFVSSTFSYWGVSHS